MDASVTVAPRVAAARIDFLLRLIAEIPRRCWSWPRSRSCFPA